MLTGYNVNFQVSALDPADEAVRLGGRASGPTLSLTMSGIERKWDSSWDLEQLSDVTRALEAVNQRAEGLRNEAR